VSPPVADRPEVGQQTLPRIEAIVCVHNTSRPVERAVGSALQNSASLRVTVIVHNTDPDAVTDRLATLVRDPRVRVLELSDGIRSPANAFNYGLDNATGQYVCLIGSDDELERGALDSWLALADTTHSDVVVAPVRRVAGGGLPAPDAGRGRTVRLDGDRDRLFERVAPLGLVRLARFAGLRFTEGLPRGVDQAYGLHMWFSGAAVAFDPTTPAYLEWDDQPDRVTTAGGPLSADFGYLDVFEGDAVFQSMSAAARRAVAARIVRVYLVGGVARRLTETGLTGEDRAALSAVLRRLRAWAPGVDGILAVRDRRALRAALNPVLSGEDVRRAIGDRSRYLTVNALLTVNPVRVLHRHAPLRSLIAGRRVARAVEANARHREAGGSASIAATQVGS
jgi:hypothetical protein